MSIGDVNSSSPNRADQLRNGYVNGAGNAGAQGAPVGKVEPTQPVKSDRVEISDAGRAAAANDLQTRELNFARKALDGIPSLSAERADEIHQRIQEGYYAQPDVMGKIARSVAIDLVNNRQI